MKYVLLIYLGLHANCFGQCNPMMVNLIFNTAAECENYAIRTTSKKFVCHKYNCHGCTAYPN